MNDLLNVENIKNIQICIIYHSYENRSALKKYPSKYSGKLNNELLILKQHFGTSITEELKQICPILLF